MKENHHHWRECVPPPRGYEPGAFPVTRILTVSLTTFRLHLRIPSFFFITPVALADSTRSQFSTVMENLQSLFESMHEQLTFANCKVKTVVMGIEHHRSHSGSQWHPSWVDHNLRRLKVDPFPTNISVQPCSLAGTTLDFLYPPLGVLAWY